MSADTSVILSGGCISVVNCWRDVVDAALRTDPFSGLNRESTWEEIDDCASNAAIQQAVRLGVIDPDEVDKAIRQLVRHAEWHIDNLPSPATIDPLLDAWGDYHEERRGAIQ